MELKRARVVMLPTKDRTDIVIFGDKSFRLRKRMDDTFIPESNGHLYFTTDEEIKEGDWYTEAVMMSHMVHQMSEKAYKGWHSTEDKLDNLKRRCRKIIATTDKSLTIESELDAYYRNGIGGARTLPHPSQAFIEKYCKLGGIDEVDVEYERKYDMRYYTPIGGIECAEIYNDRYELKVDSHNTITIHPIKNSWSREEVIKLCQKAWLKIPNDPDMLNNFSNWCEINL